MVKVPITFVMFIIYTVSLGSRTVSFLWIIYHNRQWWRHETHPSNFPFSTLLPLEPPGPFSRSPGPDLSHVRSSRRFRPRFFYLRLFLIERVSVNCYWPPLVSSFSSVSLRFLSDFIVRSVFLCLKMCLGYICQYSYLRFDSDLKTLLIPLLGLV